MSIGKFQPICMILGLWYPIAIIPIPKGVKFTGGVQFFYLIATTSATLTFTENAVFLRVHAHLSVPLDTIFS